MKTMRALLEIVRAKRLVLAEAWRARRFADAARYAMAAWEFALAYSRDMAKDSNPTKETLAHLAELDVRRNYRPRVTKAAARSLVAQAVTGYWT